MISHTDCARFRRSDLVGAVARAGLSKLGLDVGAGMAIGGIRGRIGEPAGAWRFVSDRCSYDLVPGDRHRCSVSCAVPQYDGLGYLVVMTAEQQAAAE